MMKRLQGIVIGIIAASALYTALPAIAASVQKAITVSTGITIYVDDVKLNPTDANGSPVEVFLYNGTTYLPVRAVSTALGKPIEWDGTTRSVYIGAHKSAEPQNSDNNNGAVGNTPMTQEEEWALSDYNDGGPFDPELWAWIKSNWSALSQYHDDHRPPSREELERLRSSGWPAQPTDPDEWKPLPNTFDAYLYAQVTTYINKDGIEFELRNTTREQAEKAYAETPLPTLGGYEREKVTVVKARFYNGQISSWNATVEVEYQDDPQETFIVNPDVPHFSGGFQ
jgi:hypothetical protein